MNTVIGMETSANSPADRPKVGRRRDPQKSAVQNGSKLLSGVDGRSLWVRRFKDIFGSHVADLGGADNCSAAEASIVRRAATLSVELERLERQFALAGEASAEDIDLYARVASNLRRLLEAVGLQRRSRDVTPNLREYLAGKEAVR